MGRHSRRTPDGTTDTARNEDFAAPPAAAGQAPWADGAAAQGPAGAQDAATGRRPAEGPGWGRRRRSGEGGPEGSPSVRGGHPQHGEGPAGPRPPQAPQAPGVPLVPHQRDPGGAPGGTRPGVLGTPVDPGGARPGPRQDYLDAFSDDDVFAAGAPRPPRGGRFAAPQGPAPGPQASPHGSDEDAELAAYEAELAESDGAPDDVAGRRRGSKGRTFTGVAAAAVTTVLAVVVAGQVADARKQGAVGTPVSGGDASPDADATHPQNGPTAAPATYAAKMAKLYPLAADLKGPGTFRPTGGAAAAPGRGHVVRYRVDIEDGLGLDGRLFAEAVHKTLNDDRSWAHGGQRTFERVASGKADFVITLASPGTTDEWCAKSGLDTSEERVSCDSAATERVMINAYRWARGAKTYGPGKMYSYRQMLINHEVGHRLGHDHEGCHRRGALAPVMMQQTKFLTTDGVTCRPNAWPFPTA